MICKTGGFVSIKYDELRNLTANLLKETRHDIAVEPTLLPLYAEQMGYRR